MKTGLIINCVCTALLLFCGSGAADAQSGAIEPLFPCSEKLDNAVAVTAGITRRSEDFNERDQVVADLLALGIRSMKTGIYWDTFVRKGVLNYELTDPAMESTRNSKLEMVNFFTYNNDATHNSFVSPADFAYYVKKVVARYKFYCMDWLVFQGVEYLSVNNRKITPDMYFSVLRNASRAVKEVGADHRVIMGGVTEVGRPFVDSLLSYGALNYADIMHFSHSSYPEAVVDKFRKLRESEEKYAGRIAPVWMSYGYSSYPDLEDEQAMFLPRMYILSFACGADKVFWEGYKCLEQNPKMRNHYSGLMHKDMTPKPAYYAMETMMKMMPNHCLRPKVSVQGGVYLAQWKDFEGKPVWAVWSPKEMEISLKIDGKARFTDYKGNKMKIKAFTEAGPGVVYIQGAKNVNFE